MSEPKRIQRRRAKGWRMPPGTVYVGRPTKWGNPWTGNEPAAIRSDREGTFWLVLETDEAAVAMFRAFMLGRRDFQAMARSDLAGKDLACWCPLDHSCHADVLLEIANSEVIS